MGRIVESIEIERRPEEVFAYATDPSRFEEWQESLVSAELEGSGPVGVGSRMKQTRRVGRGEQTMTTELVAYDPPTGWAFRGIDGPVRAIGEGSIEPLDDGSRSRLTMELDFEGHGIGKLLVPLFVRRQAAKEAPAFQQAMKERLEAEAD
ncbi:MAG: SRPBCC family protein [Solirubrobacterales bacterium]